MPRRCVVHGCSTEAYLLRRQRQRQRQRTRLRHSLRAAPCFACSEKWSKRDKQTLRLRGAGRLFVVVGDTDTSSICETTLRRLESSAEYMTWAAGSNPVRKRALGASRRDTCFPSCSQQGHTPVVYVLDETHTGVENAATLLCSEHSVMTTPGAFNGDASRR
jgi:hypothetical protein